MLLSVENGIILHFPTDSPQTGMAKRASPKPTVSRKKQHVELTLSRNVGFQRKSTGLEKWEFTHNALPELDPELQVLDLVEDQFLVIPDQEFVERLGEIGDRVVASSILLAGETVDGRWPTADGRFYSAARSGDCAENGRGNCSEGCRGNLAGVLGHDTTSEARSGRSPRGEALLDPAVTQRVFQEVRRAVKEEEASAFQHLSQQEKHVLLLVSEGKTNREIAKQLFLGEGTVRNYVSSILSKLGVNNRAEAAAYAVEHSLREYISS